MRLNHVVGMDEEAGVRLVGNNGLDRTICALHKLTSRSSRMIGPAFDLEIRKGCRLQVLNSPSGSPKAPNESRTSVDFPMA